MKVDKLLCCAWLTCSALASVSVAAEDSAAVLEEIVVVAHPLSGEGLSQASTVLEGDELARKRGANIGATLAQEPGIHASPFGMAVGRPVIHGLGGPRVRIMEDRIDVLDVSVTSADHAVAVEPFIAERVEVLKGPSTLLYGSGAIGGVVDVHTGRIPHNVPDRAISGGLETRYDDNTDGQSSSLKLNGGGGKFAWHLDATSKDGDDYEIPGFAESARLRALEAAEEEEEHDEEGEEVHGTLPGSAYDSESYAGGVSYIFDGGFVGVAVSKIDADYGLPGGHGHHHEEGEEGEGTPTLDLEQTRTDFELGLRDLGGVFTSLNVRFGLNDYEHREIEPSGEVGSTFTNKAWELRTELLYDTENWSGAVGFQHTDRDFSALGEEAFTPPVETRDTGIFWLTERSFANFDLEGGLRVGEVRHAPDGNRDREFTTYSASLGFVIPLTDTWQLGLVSDYSSRAPVSEELYSNGPHLVTNAFELGDADLHSERAANLAATLRYDGTRWQAELTAYTTHFSDFIYERATGAEEDELPVFQFQQDDARFYGVDAEVSTRLAEWQQGSLQLRGMLDFVEAELDVSGNDNIPRIPPLRYGLGLEIQAGLLTASLDYLRVTEQDEVTDQELMTSAYEDLSLYLGAKFSLSERAGLNVFVAAKNLTDDEQRHHTSFIKEFAPAPGRSLEFGVRLLF